MLFFINLIQFLGVLTTLLIKIAFKTCLSHYLLFSPWPIRNELFTCVFPILPHFLYCPVNPLPHNAKLYKTKTDENTVCKREKVGIQHESFRFSQDLFCQIKRIVPLFDCCVPEKQFDIMKMRVIPVDLIEV